jgi:hypothetical protein
LRDLGITLSVRLGADVFESRIVAILASQAGDPGEGDIERDQLTPLDPLSNLGLEQRDRRLASAAATVLDSPVLKAGLRALSPAACLYRPSGKCRLKG